MDQESGASHPESEGLRWYIFARLRREIEISGVGGQRGGREPSIGGRGGALSIGDGRGRAVVFPRTRDFRHPIEVTLSELAIGSLFPADKISRPWRFCVLLRVRPRAPRRLQRLKPTRVLSSCRGQAKPTLDQCQANAKPVHTRSAREPATGRKLTDLPGAASRRP